jgi:hypothetical protein
MWMKVLQSPDNNMTIIDYRILISVYLFLPSDCDFDSVEMTIIRRNFYVPEGYYKFVEQ